MIFTGIDILSIKDFADSLKNGGETFKRKVFTNQELSNQELKHLAGIFAAKEAVIKALSIKPGKWLEIEIFNEKSGRPFVKLINNFKLKSYDLSISHTKNTAVAVFVALQ